MVFALCVLSAFSDLLSLLRSARHQAAIANPAAQIEFSTALFPMKGLNYERIRRFDGHGT
jgi:hypothetical protein